MDETWFDRVFTDPDRVGQSEYLAIYDVAQVFSDDPEMVAGILDEFRAWSSTLLSRMQDQGVLRQAVDGERAYFTPAGAQAKVGRRIRTLVAWSGVPKATTGSVIRADEGANGWTIAIQWDLPTEPRQVGIGEVDGAPYVVITGGKPLVDWFSRNEYERYLEELEDDAKEA